MKTKPEQKRKQKPDQPDKQESRSKPKPDSQAPVQLFAINMSFNEVLKIAASGAGVSKADDKPENPGEELED